MCGTSSPRTEQDLKCFLRVGSGSLGNLQEPSFQTPLPSGCGSVLQEACSGKDGGGVATGFRLLVKGGETGRRPAGEQLTTQLHTPQRALSLGTGQMSVAPEELIQPPGCPTLPLGDLGQLTGPLYVRCLRLQTDGMGAVNLRRSGP